MYKGVHIWVPEEGDTSPTKDRPPGAGNAWRVYDIDGYTVTYSKTRFKDFKAFSKWWANDRWQEPIKPGVISGKFMQLKGSKLPSDIQAKVRALVVATIKDTEEARGKADSLYDRLRSSKLSAEEKKLTRADYKSLTIKIGAKLTAMVKKIDKTVADSMKAKGLEVRDEHVLGGATAKNSQIVYSSLKSVAGTQSQTLVRIMRNEFTSPEQLVGTIAHEYLHSKWYWARLQAHKAKWTWAGIPKARWNMKAVTSGHNIDAEEVMACFEGLEKNRVLLGKVHKSDFGSLERYAGIYAAKNRSKIPFWLDINSYNSRLSRGIFFPGPVHPLAVRLQLQKEKTPVVMK